MDFLEEIRSIGLRAKKSIDVIKTEEATKQAFIVPFIKALGYDVYDPIEVVPEFTADVGTKKGEKVDYAIMRDNNPIILIECKWCGKSLDKLNASQLYRYFSVTESRIAILTNGIDYQFFTDLEKAHTMDKKPFLEINMLNIDDSIIPELKKLSKEHFNLDNIISSASELKYTKAIKTILLKEIEQPSDEFTKFFVSKIYDGRITQSVLNEFRGMVKKSLANYINDSIKMKFKSIMSNRVQSENIIIDNEPESKVSSILDISGNMSKYQRDDEKIDTTDDEVNGFLAVVDALKGSIDKDRIIWKDAESYFSIILDDNNRKPICRLHFNSSQKYIALFDNDETKGKKIPIKNVDEIRNYTVRLIDTVNNLRQ